MEGRPKVAGQNWTVALVARRKAGSRLAGAVTARTHVETPHSATDRDALFPALLADRDAILAEMVEREWADVAMVTTATAHRNAEIELARRDEERRATLVRGLLFGTLPLAEIRDQAQAYGFDTTRTYVAVHAQPSWGSTSRDLDAALGFLDATMHRPGLRVTLDGDLAGFLRNQPSGEIPGTVGVGPPRPLEELADSFRLATRAFRCAQRFGLTGVYTIDDLGLLPSIAEDRDVGEALCRRYLAPLGDGGSAAELRATLRAYFECSMNVECAAERVYVHRNTVRYRIARFEELTGAQLRDARTACEVWWALEHASIQADPRGGPQ
jgi:sugar diacid utilization regulator